MPLTHREHTSAVTFVTGHAVEAIDWDKVGHAETLVIFMGLTTFPEIARELIARGRSPETPAMAVRWATRPDQETLVGTLATLPGLIAARGLKPPATIIVGEVVRLREKLDWYERLPLFGKRIVVTRATRAGRTRSRRACSALGADVIELPTIEIRPPADYGPLDRAIADLAVLRLADLHQRQRRPLLPRAPGPRPSDCARCAPRSAPSARPPAPPSKRCT